MNALLEQPVLVLNRLWQAINICTVRRALVLLVQGRAAVVLQNPDGSYQTLNFNEWRDLSRLGPSDECIHTISFRIRIPKIILLLMYERFPRKEVKFTRQNIFERDRNTCQYCGRAFPREELNLDHVIPKHRGGQTTWENVVCSCIECNAKKGNRTPEEAGMKLIRKPRRPKWRPFIQFSLHTPTPESWKQFIDYAYWNVELGDELE
jgi:5-methylcytosine-specific restriction endonuclease McrA